MTPRKRPAVDVIYNIAWNGIRRSWDVHRQDKPNGGFSMDRSTAIGMAVKQAQFEAREGVTVAVTATLNGKTRVEWSGG